MALRGGDGTSGGNTSGTTGDTIGQECMALDDSPRGRGLCRREPQRGTPGYCTILNCQTSADCVFEGVDGNFCCSTYGEYRGCWQKNAFTVCGDESGQQDDPCNEGGQTDCAGEEGYYCAAIYSPRDSRCMMTCDPSQLCEHLPHRERLL